MTAYVEPSKTIVSNEEAVYECPTHVNETRKSRITNYATYAIIGIDTTKAYDETVLMLIKNRISNQDIHNWPGDDIKKLTDDVVKLCSKQYASFRRIRAYIVNVMKSLSVHEIVSHEN